MAQGEVNLYVGINLDDALKKIELLEKKLQGLPDVKADVQVVGTKADTQLNALQQRLQKKATDLTVKAKADFSEINDLTSAAEIGTAAVKGLKDAAEKNPIKVKADQQGLDDLNLALGLIAETLGLVGAEVNGTTLKPKVDLSELIALNKELDRKQKHWRETRQMIESRPMRAQASQSADNNIRRTVRPQVQTPGGGVRGYLPGRPERQSNFVAEQFRLLMGTAQSKAGVLASFRSQADMGRLFRDLTSGAAPAQQSKGIKGVYGDALQKFHKRQFEKDWARMMRNSRYTDSEIDAAIEQISKINRGELPSNLKERPGLKPGQQLRRRDQPDIPEVTESGKLVNEYVRRRSERINGVKRSANPSDSFRFEELEDLNDLFREVDQAVESYSKSSKDAIDFANGMANTFRQMADAFEGATTGSDIQKVNVKVVDPEVVGQTQKALPPGKTTSVAAKFKEAIDAIKQSDIRQFTETANMLFESLWSIGGKPEWKGLTRKEAKAAYVEEWRQRLMGPSLPGGSDSGQALPAASDTVNDAGRRTLQIQRKLHDVRLGKRELEGLQNALELDNEENASTKALTEAKIKLAQRMTLTRDQLAVLAYELDNNPKLDSIKELKKSEIEREYPGEYLANAQAAFTKIRQQAFDSGVIRRDTNGNVAITDGRQAQSSKQVSAIETFTRLIADIAAQHKASQPYKPSSRMFGGPMSEWTEDQQRKYKEAQSAYRAHAKQSKTIAGLQSAIGYNKDFQSNFARIATEGLAGIIEQRKGGLAAKTTGDLAGALTNAPGRADSLVRLHGGTVPDSRKAIADELRGLSDQGVESFVNGILAKAQDGTEAGVRMGRALIQGIKAALDMHSPSKVLIALGREAALSLYLGWQQMMSELAGRFEKITGDAFDFAVKTPALGADYKTLTSSIADLTIDPAQYGKKIQAVGLQNMPGSLLKEASARGTFQDFFPDAKIERIAKQLPGTLERLIDSAYVKSFNKFSSSRFVSSDLSPTQGFGQQTKPINPGIKQKVNWTGRPTGLAPGWMARDGETGRILKRREALAYGDAIAEKRPTGIGGGSLPLFGTQNASLLGNAIPDPWQTFSMQGQQAAQVQRAAQPPMRQLLLPPARKPEPSVASVFQSPATSPADFQAAGRFSMGSSTAPSQQNVNRTADRIFSSIDSVLSAVEQTVKAFHRGYQKVGDKANQAVDAAQQFVRNIGDQFQQATAAGAGGVGGGTGGRGPGGPGSGGPGGIGPAGPATQSPNNFAFNDWLDEILPNRGTGSRQGFSQSIEQLRNLEDLANQRATQAEAAKSYAQQFKRDNAVDGKLDPALQDYYEGLKQRAQQLQDEAALYSRAARSGRVAVSNYGTTGNLRDIVDNVFRQESVSEDGSQYRKAGAFNRNGIVDQTLRSIGSINDQFAGLNQLMANLDSSSIVQTNQALNAVEQSLETIRALAAEGLIDKTDLDAAEAGARRVSTALNAQAAETRNLAKDFETLGIQSEASIDALRRVRDEANRNIQASNLSDAEKARANNARDIQELSYIQEQIRGAQGASGFGGFRGREIGDEKLNQSLQRTELRNYIRNLEEARNNMRLRVDQDGDPLNAKSLEQAVQALDRQINNAQRSFRVLSDQASDGERAFETMRNAFGVFSDDLGNLIPQLIAFDFAFNVLYSTLLPLPRVILQTTAEFDRLETSISTYLRNTRNITDSTEVIDELKQQALDLGTGFEQSAQSYLSFAAAMKGTPLEGQELDVTRTLGTAGRNMGLSRDQIGRVSNALTQILGKGTVQMEELRQQLAEQMPGALQIAARAFGVTTAELYKMVGAGEIAGDVFVEKFIAQLKAEGANVNALSGNFANLQEQLGAALEQLGATAGRPLFLPLTLGLQGLVAIIKAVIPLAGVLSVGALVLGANMAKAALGIKSWRSAMGDLGRAGFALAMGDREAAGQALSRGKGGGQPRQSNILDATGTPIPVSSQPTGQSGKGNLGRVSQGAKDAVKGIKEAIGALVVFDKTGTGAGQKAGDRMKAFGTAIRGAGDGLKGVTAGMAGLGKATLAALAPALKFYAAIEAISFVAKSVSGEFNNLKSDANVIDAINKGQPLSNAAKYTYGDRVASELNIGALVGRIQEQMQGDSTLQAADKVYKTLQQKGEAYAKWRKQDTQLAIKESRLAAEAQNEKLKPEKRDELTKRIGDVRRQREKLRQDLPYSPEEIAAMKSSLKNVQNNAQQRITELLRTSGVGEDDIKKYLDNKVDLDKITNAGNISAVSKAQVENFKKQSDAAKEKTKSIDNLTEKLKIYEKVVAALPMTTARFDAEIKSIQERISNLDLKSPNNRKVYDEGVAKIGALTNMRDFISLSTQQQETFMLEQKAKTLQQISQKEQAAGQVRLEQLQRERMALEANLELQRKKADLAERQVQDRIDLSKQLGFDGDALQAEKELADLQAKNRQADIAGQRKLLDNDKQRYAIERDMKKAELRATTAQLRAQASEANERFFSLSKAAQMAAVDRSPEGQRNAQAMKILAQEAQAARNALNQTANSYEKLIGSADKMYDANVRVANIKQQVLDIESRLVNQGQLSEQQRIFIEQETNQLNKQLEAYTKLAEVEDRRAQRLGEQLQKKIDSSEQYLQILQKETQAIQDNLSLQQQVLDARIQQFRNREQGGFYTRMGAFADTAEGDDLFTTGQKRKQAMEQMAERQKAMAELNLQVEEQRLKIEREIYNLELERQRISLTTQKAQLATQMAILQLQLREGARADRAAGRTQAASQKEAYLTDINAALKTSGIPTATQVDANGTATEVASLKGLMDEVNRAIQGLAATGQQGTDRFNELSRVQSRLNEITRENIGLQYELAQIDANQWWREFLDGLGGLGTVLSEASQGISDFRKSIADTVAQGLRDGQFAEGFSDAAGELADRLVSTIVDEFVLKPMEENMYKGLQALFGDQFKKETPEQVFKDGSEKIVNKIGETMNIDQNMLNELQQIKANTANLSKLFDTTYQAPQGPAQVGAAAATATATGGYATFGETGRVRNADGWVHGHFQTNTASLETLIQDVKPVLKQLVEKGVPVELSNGTRIKAGQSDAYYEQMLRSGAAQHGHSGDGRSIDLFMPEGTKVPVPLSDVRHGSGREGSSGVLPGSGQSWVGHLTRDSKAGGPVPVTVVADQTNKAAQSTQATQSTQSLGSTQTYGATTTGLIGAFPELDDTAWDEASQSAQQAGTSVDSFSQAAQSGATSSQALQQGMDMVGMSLQTFKAALEQATTAAGGLAGAGYGSEIGVANGYEIGGSDALSAASDGYGSMVGLEDSANQLATAQLDAATKVQSAANSAGQMPGTFSSLGGAIQGFTGILGSVGMALGGIAMMGEGGTYNTLMGLSSIFGALGGIFGLFGGGFGGFFADGGSVSAHTPIVVGEKGPELFVPTANGEILTNRQTASLLNGTQETFSDTRASLTNQRKAMQAKAAEASSAIQMTPIDVRYESQVINNVEYVTSEQHRKGMDQAARRGQLLAYQGMQNSLKVRKRLGMS